MTQDFNQKNPFHAPPPLAGGSGQAPVGVSRGMVGQVMPVSICMIVLGVIEVLLSLMFIGLAFFVPSVIANQPNQPNMSPEELAFAQSMITWFYGGGGAVALMSGSLRVIAGIQSMRFRGRGLAIASHFLGLSTMVLCYCIPTSVGMAIWGCIVHFNSGVKGAFAAQAQGYSLSDLESKQKV